MSTSRLRSALEALPTGTLVPRDQLLALLDEEGGRPPHRPEPLVNLQVSESWRERLWTCPPDTRLGVEEMVEGLGRSKSWIYKRTAPKAESRIPHRRLDGSLVFLAGEVREWVRAQEETVVPGPIDRLGVS